MTNRRHFLAGLGAGLTLPAVSHLPALAKAPLAGAQAAGIYRFKVGDFEVTTLSDGYIDLDAKLFSGKPEDIQTMLAASPQRNPLRGQVNAFVVNTGEALIVVDTGGPASAIPTLGRFPEALKAAGFDAANVDAVVLTHLHVDHVGGLTDAQGAAAFANAQLIVSEDDHAFWTSAEMMAKAPKEAQFLFQVAQASVKPYAERLALFKGEKDVIKGITSVPAAGHTPGHAAYRIASGNDQLLIWGDVVHAPNLQFAHPEWTIAFDTDAAAAAATRARIFDMAAADKLRVAGMHLHFPAEGFVEKTGNAYAYVPAQWSSGL
jgi:glyoxylase-like metal-dependent hydrolase (beta-lactamase superfamily II)